MVIKKLIVLTSFVLVMGLTGFAQAELLVNTGFEADLEGWKTWGGGSGSGAGGWFYNFDTHATVMNDGTANSGEKYVEVGIADVEGSWWAVSLVFQEHPVTEGQAYEISGWFRDGNANGVPSLVEGGGMIQWEWRDATPGEGSDTGERGGLLDGGRITHSFDLTDEWTYVSATEVAPPGAKGATVIFGTTWGGINLDVDDTSYTEVLPAQDPNPADGATGVSPAALLKTYISDDVPLDIPDRGRTMTTVYSSLNISDPLTITDLNVELDIFQPVNNADLNVFLIGPDGTRVELFTDVGLLTIDDFKNTIIDDEASISVVSGTGRFTGIYKPEGQLSVFDGKNAQGTWKLEITDDWANNAGRLNSWRLVIESPSIISWVPADNIASQDVYISSNFNEVNDSAKAAYIGNFATDVSAIEIDLESDQSYFWRIDSVDADGMLIAAGDIWSFSTASDYTTLDIRVAAGTDDAEEAANSGYEGAYSSSLDLEILGDFANNGGKKYVGMNFRDVAITPGMNIINSYIEFVCDETNDDAADDVYLLLWGNLSLNPDGFVDPLAPTAISDLPRTETKVPWAPEPWIDVGQISQTSDISSIIEEIVNQEGWTSGNAIEIIIGEDKNMGAFSGNRTAESYDGSSSQAPLLHIDTITVAAVNPAPADGSIDAAHNVVLTWSKGFNSFSSDVYFGTDSSPKMLETTTGNSYDVGKLDAGTTYYWRIDETDVDGNKHTGAVWSFTTQLKQAIDPYPADGAIFDETFGMLMWTAGQEGAISHDVYFGTDPEALEYQISKTEGLIAIGIPGRPAPDGLVPGTTYYWRIDLVYPGSIATGEVWNFSVAEP